MKNNFLTIKDFEIAKSQVIEKIYNQDLIKSKGPWKKGRHLKVLDEYKDESYEYINKTLRGHFINQLRVSKEDINNKIKLLDFIINEKVNIGEILYRVAKYNVSSDIKKLNIGDIYNEKAFLSTSLNEKTVNSYLRYERSMPLSNPIKMIIEIDSNVKGIKLKNKPGQTKEDEILLQRNLNLQLIKKNQNVYYFKTIK